MKGMMLDTAAICLAACPVQAAGYSQKDKAIHHLASAMAYAKLCPRIATDKTKSAILMKLARIEPDGADGDLIVFEANNLMSRLNDKSEDAICAAGLLLYGRKGAISAVLSMLLTDILSAFSGLPCRRREEVAATGPWGLKCPASWEEVRRGTVEHIHKRIIVNVEKSIKG